MAMFGDMSRIPGDLGDARFNNYILEHFHRFLTGQEPSLWDLPSMYPYRNVLALPITISEQVGSIPFSVSLG